MVSHREPSSLADLSISNLEDNEERRYPVILLRGQASNENALTLRAEGHVFDVPVVDGCWKALVELVPGVNHIYLQCGVHEIARTVQYRPASTAFKVKPFYITANDGKTDYITQFSRDKQNFEDKYVTALKLLQTFTAEQMHRAGHGYKTFALDYDDKGRIPITVLSTAESQGFLQTLDGQQLFDLCSRLIYQHSPDERCKKIAIMAFTGYDAKSQTPLAHTALGGETVALFSCNGMCSWPDDIADVQRAFSDTTPVDSAKIWDDTNGRSQLWALSSTAIGVTLHELGHTFGLLHQPDPFSIMSRGFDFFNRVFTVNEPGFGGEFATTIPDSQTARWDVESAALLNRSPWFQPDFAVVNQLQSKTFAVLNLDDGERRSYPVLLLRGFAPAGANVIADVQGSGMPNKRFECKVVNGEFKLLLELLPGDNQIRIAAGPDQMTRLVNYTPRTTPNTVKIVYVTANDGDTRYLSQFPDDPQNFRDKLGVAIKLMQTFTAEQMRNAGYGYRTFTVDYDADGLAVVDVVRCQENVGDLRKLDQIALYHTVRGAIRKKFPNEDCAVMAIASFTGYEPATQTLLGHTAVGHDRVTVFSCNGMCAWPAEINQVAAAFSDSTPVDMSKNWDDSNGRGSLWALASTTIGVNLHLLGFALGLSGQRQDPFSMTSRGFDYFNRFFMCAEPAISSGQAIEIDESNSARWDVESARELNDSPWIG